MILMEPKNDRDLKAKRHALEERLKGLGSLVVAFSGGVDSSFLLAVAQEMLGDKVLAVTAASAFHPGREKEDAVRFCRERGIDHVVITGKEMDLPEFVSNPPDRCYHCKKSILAEVKKLAAGRGIPHIAHAANMDDFGDYRPGWIATVEAGTLAPLVEAGLGKAEIRSLSREMGLPCWNKPSMACLASRIPYGEVITLEKLRAVEQAEEFLFQEGFSQFRVRHHGTVARIEVDGPELDKLMAPELRSRIVAELKGLGFLHVALDLEGYTTGSLNRVLKEQEE